MKSRNILIILFSIGIFSFIGYVSLLEEFPGHVPYVSFTHDYPLEDKLINEISEMNLHDSITLSNYTQFDWNELYIICPYISLDNLKINTDINFDELKYTGIQMLDDIQVLAFINNGTMNKFVVMPHHNFCLENYIPNMTQDVAVFVLTLDDSYFVELTPAKMYGT